MKALVFVFMTLPIAAVAHTGPDLTLQTATGESPVSLALALPVAAPEVMVCDLPAQKDTSVLTQLACAGN